MFRETHSKSGLNIWILCFSKTPVRIVSFINASSFTFSCCVNCSLNIFLIYLFVNFVVLKCELIGRYGASTTVSFSCTYDLLYIKIADKTLSTDIEKLILQFL